MKCVFDFPAPGGRVERIAFDSPRAVVLAHTPQQVVPALNAIEAAQREGRYCAGFVSFDAASAFDDAFQTQRDPALPLLAFGVFDSPAARTLQGAAPPPAARWSLDTERETYLAQTEALRQHIYNGVAYQINHTLRAHAVLEGDPFAHYEQLRRAQDCDYAAYLELGDTRILCASPELFFTLADGTLSTRPMKGTAPRGRWPEEDEALRDALFRSEKERAENLMIVDLLRNDLSRLSQPFGVRVQKLFDIERYPTLFQMTSTVEAKLRPETTLADIFRALFPSGSVTGAPKIKAMELIHQTETSPRGVYCGAIGLLTPHHTVFNVAIRTVVLDVVTSQARCGLGSGITYDSRPEREFEEIQIKSRFLNIAPQPFELLETLLFDGQTFWLRERHLERMARSARHFGFAFDRERIERALDAWRLDAPAKRHRVRLLLGAGGALRMESTVLTEDAAASGPVVVPLARRPLPSHTPLLFHKTTQREHYEAQSRDFPQAFDVLLWNERGQITEFTRGNVVVEIDGRRVTPPLECGLLGGTFREELLNRGEIEERALSRQEVLSARRIWFVNSVRGWVEVMLDDYDQLGVNRPLPPASDADL